MIRQKYLDIIKEIVASELDGGDFECFIFGSALNRERFGDVDLGFKGKISPRKISLLKERFEASILPFAVDVVDFNQAGEEFKKNVFDQKIIWLKR